MINAEKVKYIREYPTKYNQGFVQEEIEALLKDLEIDPAVFFPKLGINTCMVIDSQVITYHCDIELAVNLCLENREANFYEWD